MADTPPKTRHMGTKRGTTAPHTHEVGLPGRRSCRSGGKPDRAPGFRPALSAAMRRLPAGTQRTRKPIRPPSSLYAVHGRGGRIRTDDPQTPSLANHHPRQHSRHGRCRHDTACECFHRVVRRHTAGSQMRSCRRLCSVRVGLVRWCSGRHRGWAPSVCRAPRSAGSSGERGHRHEPLASCGDGAGATRLPQTPRAGAPGQSRRSRVPRRIRVPRGGAQMRLRPVQPAGLSPPRRYRPSPSVCRAAVPPERTRSGREW